MNSKNIVITIIILVLIAAVAYLFINQDDEVMVENEPTAEEDAMPVESDEGIGDGAEPLPEEEERPAEDTLGQSVSGQDIVAYHFGEGDTEILLVGGAHGSYSPNTSALAYEAIDHYRNNESSIPSNISLTIIPELNPDGLDMEGTAGRFNSNEVDLNRNFDCEWSATGMWRQQEVSGGSAPFSEPEATALRDYVLASDPEAAIVLFSAEGKVYPSACGEEPSNASVALASTYASAADYPTEPEFDAYSITGDMVNWMAKEGIPAISVLLSDHQNAEWNKNQAGIEAVLNSYAQ